MMHSAALRSTLACVVILTAAAAQTSPVIGYHVDASIGWSTVTNPSAAPITSSPVVITQASSPWLKLWFGAVNLGAASRIRITGAQDDVVQILDAAALAAWSNSSAYFNGDTVVVELIVAPGDSASATVTGYDVGFAAPMGVDSICGPTDDRVPSTERRVGRLINSSAIAICSGGLVSANSCYLSAGHCLAGGTAFAVEFNCPQSTPGGAVVHPGPQDQYPMNTLTLAFVNGGLGNDWAVARLFDNTTTGLPASLVQGHYVLASAIPAGGTLIRVTGFGVAQGVLNASNQTATGPLTTPGTGTWVGYLVDVNSQNSGSTLIRESDQTVIGICTHAACTPTGGENYGTAIVHPGPQAQYAAVCTPNPPAYSVSLSQSGAGAPIFLTVSGAPPSSELYNLVSLTPATPTNSGPIVGLNIGSAELLGLISLPLGTEPFHVLGSPTGTYAFGAPGKPPRDGAQRRRGVGRLRAGRRLPVVPRPLGGNQRDDPALTGALRAIGTRRSRRAGLRAAAAQFTVYGRTGDRQPMTPPVTSTVIASNASPAGSGNGPKTALVPPAT